MPIRKVLLPLTGTEAGRAALQTAWLATEAFRAHLACIHVRLDSRDVTPLAGEGLSGAMIEEMMQASESESGQRAAVARAMFDAFVAEHAIPEGPAPFDARRATAGFTAMVGREDDLVAQLARLADLTVVPHPEADEDLSSSDALHAVLFDSGRPVLIAPLTPPATLGTRVAVAWNGTAECTAALMAALPWVQRAGTVRIVESDEYYRRGPRAPALAEYLALHGVTADIRKFRSIDREVGAGLLAAARDFGADLLTMGAYSHSRIRQLILGGVTRHVLEHATLPVLMNR
jgi:nucleotide-binding universal stress UspA family protein